MKTCFVLLVSVLMSVGCASASLAAEPHANKFSRVVEAEGFTQQQLYGGISEWIALNFASAKAVTDHSDPERGVIIAKGNTPLTSGGLFSSSERIHFTMKVDTKDGKFRLAFSNLERSWDGSKYNKPAPFPYGYKTFKKAKKRLLAFGNEILKFLASPEGQTDW